MNYTDDELKQLGFAEIGADVRLHRSVVLINPEQIRIGNNVRIDCFCVLSAGAKGISIGSCVHIAANSCLFGSGEAIILEDFCGLSSRVSIYTSTEDYTGSSLTNPTIPDEFRNVKSGSVILRKHAIVGAGSVILPGVELKTGASIGALTCIRKDVGEFEICVGNAHQLRVIGHRDQKLLETEATYRESKHGKNVFQTPGIQ